MKWNDWNCSLLFRHPWMINQFTFVKTEIFVPVLWMTLMTIAPWYRQSKYYYYFDYLNPDAKLANIEIVVDRWNNWGKTAREINVYLLSGLTDVWGVFGKRRYSLNYPPSFLFRYLERIIRSLKSCIYLANPSRMYS